MPIAPSFATFIIGIILLIASNVMYYVRTKDKQVLQRPWLGKDILTQSELILNRVGLGLSVIGIVWMLLDQFVL